MKTLLLIFLTFILFTSCSHRVREKPTAVVVTRPVAPYTGAVWIEDEYRWSGGSYVVVPGHYVRNSRTWHPGHWRPGMRGYRWVRGHWR